MKRTGIKLLAGAALCTAVACNNRNTNKTADKTVNAPDTPSVPAKPDTAVAAVEEEGQFAIYQVLIADTGSNYYSLNEKMYLLAKEQGMEIDTMNRYYNRKKGIILRENDEDELYAGVYFPRRNASASLSIEYLNIYDTTVEEGVMALVAGLYANGVEANAALDKLKTKELKAYLYTARVYIGCMH